MSEIELLGKILNALINIKFIGFTIIGILVANRFFK